MAEDRVAALATGDALSASATGSVLFVDVAGFTPLTDRLVASLGPQRGAEELTLLLNRVFAGLVEAAEWMGGVVVAFAGDALSCWFDGDDGLAATAAGLAMQAAMRPLRETPLPDGSLARLTTRAAVATGSVTRSVLGDPAVQLFEGLDGPPVAAAAAGQQSALPGEVVLDAATAGALADRVTLGERRGDGRFAVVAGLRVPFAPEAPEPPEPPGADTLRPWVARAVFERLGEPPAEIRPAVALFLGLDGVAGHAALDACVRRAQAVLEGYGGMLFDLSRDDKGIYLKGALGVPSAHGDDLLRAVTAVHELRTPPAGVQAVRAGLAAGSVYASVYGAPRRRCYGLNGTTVTLAARLMQHAPPGGVRMSGGFGAATARRFSIRTLPPLELKGYAEPVPAAELLGPREDEALTREEPRPTVPLVGRRAELRTARAALRRASGGRGQLLGVSGEPGLGKSRLLAEIARLAAGFEIAAGGADALATVPYLAWRPIWRRLLGDDPERLREALAEIDPALVPRLPLLAPVLGLALPDNEVTGPIPAAARQPILHAMLRRCLTARAARRPLLLVLEDCHWLDSLSLELLAEAGAWAAELPVLVLAAYRPEAAVACAEEIRLPPLTEDESAELIALKLRELSGPAGDVPAGLVERVTERSDGNPFFVEELLNHLHDVGLEAAGEVELPATVHSLILQRLDRLPAPQRLALKPAAVIGRRFGIGWVQSLDPELPDPAASFEAVARVDLIAQDVGAPELTYLFRHIATWEAVYQSIPFAARAGWHGALAERLEALPGVPAAVLAYHFGRAGQRRKELAHALAAGEQAVAHGAYREAEQHLRRARELVAGLDAPAQELALELSLGGLLLTTRGQASPEAKARFDRALALTERVPPGPDLVRALFGLWTFYLFRGDMRPTDELAGQILAAAERFGDPELLLQAHFAVSATVYWLADFAGCVEHADAVDRLYDPAQADRYLATYAQNPRVTAAADAAWAEWIMGRPERARSRAEATVAHARELEQPFTLTIALQVPALVAVHAGDAAWAAAAGQEWLQCASAVGNPVYIGLATACVGWARAAAGDREGLGMLAAVREGFVDQGVGIVDPLLVTMLADALLRCGEAEAGLALLDGAMPAAEGKGQLAYLAEQHRLRGELARLAGRDGEPDLRRALELAREQGAAAYALRAEESLAARRETIA